MTSTTSTTSATQALSLRPTECLHRVGGNTVGGQDQTLQDQGILGNVGVMVWTTWNTPAFERRVLIRQANGKTAKAPRRRGAEEVLLWFCVDGIVLRQPVCTLAGARCAQDIVCQSPFKEDFPCIT